MLSENVISWMYISLWHIDVLFNHLSILLSSREQMKNMVPSNHSRVSSASCPSENQINHQGRKDCFCMSQNPIAVAFTTFNLIVMDLHRCHSCCPIPKHNWYPFTVLADRCFADWTIHLHISFLWLICPVFHECWRSPVKSFWRSWPVNPSARSPKCLETPPHLL